MERRGFLASSALAALAPLLAESSFGRASATAGSPEVKKIFNFTTPYSNDSLQELYNGVRGGTPAPQPPQIFLYYDTDSTC